MAQTPTGRGSGGPSDRAAKIAAAAPRDTSRTRLIAGVVVALLVVAGIAFAVLQGTKANQTPASPSNSSGSAASGVPALATGMGQGYVLNADKVKAGAPTLDIYEDFQCPWCHRFHTALAGTIKQIADSGDAKVVVHMMSFLDDNTRATYSRPVANAAACAADAGKFVEFHDAAMDGQLAEGTNIDQAKLDEWAGTAGISGGALDTWKKCVSDNSYAAYVKAVQDEAGKANITSTPTYRVNGTEVQWLNTQDADAMLKDSPNKLRDAVTSATK